MIPYETIYDLPDILDDAYGRYYHKAEEIREICKRKLKANEDIIHNLKEYNHLAAIYEKILELSELIIEDVY
jgi:hypothetical protein